MPSGPALKQLHAHRSIHEGAYTEGKQLTELLHQLYSEGRNEHAAIVAKALVEHWETRTLAHAQAEEEGFYLEMIELNPDLTEKVHMLERDHDLMRILVHEIKQGLEEDSIDPTVLHHFQSLMFIVQIHSRDEERFLLS